MDCESNCNRSRPRSRRGHIVTEASRCVDDIGNIESWQLQVTVNERCEGNGGIFFDGFEAGDASAWSSTAP